jgi:predicted aspartyl protease
MRSLWMALVVLGAFSASTSAAAKKSDANADPPREESVFRVPFKLHRGFAIVVRGSIGTVKNLNFLIDTGASPTVVDCRVARKLRLAVSARQLSTFTQKVAVDQAMAADVRLGPLHDDELRVLVHDLSVLEEALGVRVDAMVGYDFLKQGPFTIDYVSRNILFGPIDPGLETIPYVGDLPYVVVLMRVRDADLPLLVDTGAHDLIVFENGIEDIGKTTSEKPSLTWTNLGGEIKVKPLDFSHSLLGRMPWSDREAFLLQGSHTNYSAGFQGLLGVAALQTSRVSFDPVRRLFAWESKIPRIASASDPRRAESSTGGK